MNIYNWHDWFAWFPVSTQDGQLVWLKTVQRRMKKDARQVWWGDFSGYAGVDFYDEWIYKTK